MLNEDSSLHSACASEAVIISFFCW